MKFKNMLLFTMLILMFISFTGANAVVTLTDCNAIPTSNTIYNLSSTFLYSSSNCFNFENKENITINGNLIDIPSNIGVSIEDSRNITLNEINAESIYINTYAHGEFYSDDFSLINSRLYKQDSLFYYGGGIRYTSGSGWLRNWNISNNYILNPTTTRKDLFLIHKDDCTSTGSTHHDKFYNLTMDNNDIINIDSVFRGADGGCNNRYNRFYFYENLDFKYNNFAGITKIFDEYIAPTFNGIVFVSGLSSDWTGTFLNTPITDSNHDGVSDSFVSYSNDGVVLYNRYFDSISPMNNPDLAGFEKDTYFINTPNVQPSLIKSNSNYIVSNYIKTNITSYFDFSMVQFSSLDLFAMPNRNILDLDGIRSLRMGSNNKMINSNPLLTDKPIVETSQFVNPVYTDLFDSNYQLIEYFNNFEINNVEFGLNHGDYMLVRIANDGLDGGNFIFKDNYVDVNYVTAYSDMPIFTIGCMADVENNYFEMGSQENISLFGYGLCDNVGGGHKFINNEFVGGGLIFQWLMSAPANNFENTFVANGFKSDGGSIYSVPFSLNGYTFLQDVFLNSSYYYKTTCTNYEFNIGNYYELYEDDIGWIDGNGDGINDDWQNWGVSMGGGQINDYRMTTSYPYNFAGNIGSAIASYDTCLSFDIDITSPIAQNYSDVPTITTNWKTSGNYNGLYCFENLNDNSLLYENVNINVNKGYTYDVTNGVGIYQVVCCDNIQCDNIVKESDIINFKVGTSENLLVVTGITTPVEDVYGCTNSTANNYNPSATIDDGSCTYGTGGTNNSGAGFTGDFATGFAPDIFSSDIDTTFENTRSFISDFSGGILNVLIPILMFFCVIMVIALIRVVLF